MIVRNFRVGLAHDGKQRGFAYIGETNQSHICQKLKLKDDVVTFTGKSGLRKVRHLPRGSGEMLIAPAAAAAARGDKIFAGGHIVHNGAGLGIPNKSAPGTLIYKVSPSLPEQRLPSPCPPFPATYLRL